MSALTRFNEAPAILPGRGWVQDPAGLKVMELQ